ncbi:hypothetical protein HF325_000644 [Metschnikowia pulcherrima]|uniref:Plasma membrane iron permease n=1 Tax=Metschnikowia pulcherrima TaxID=27326 RepID=A0A8H7LHL4_9ASCO|nr:hypothetical protein HF325_000644 [Metschnikowia pulcherrima]
MADVFNVQIFFVVFRETLEAVVVVSVLLAFLKQGLGGATNDPVVYKKLRKQVWLGAILGVGVCLILGCAFIAVFYTLKKDIWGQSEDIWEGVFCMIAAVMITFMGLAMLRINKMREKWRIKSIWYFETYVFNTATGGDATENGSGPGTYDITKSVWHVNCCHPSLDNGWNIFNALFGWQNLATYGSVISYNIYWLFIIVTVLAMAYEEKHGHLPFLKNAKLRSLNPMYHIKGKKQELSQPEKEELFEKVRRRQLEV